MKTTLFRFLISISCFVPILKSFGQTNICSKAQVILSPGTYNLKFEGEGSKLKDLNAYPSLSEIDESNSLWMSFIAPFDGRFSFEATTEAGNLTFILFESNTFDECSDIHEGKGEIKRIIAVNKNLNAGLNQKIDETHLYPLDLLKGTKLLLFFGNDSKKKSNLAVKINLERLTDEASLSNEQSKIVDKRPDPFSPPLTILVRDAETGAPVIADLVIEGLNGITGFYRASDLFFVISKTGTINIKCDAQGYFFIDRMEPVQLNSAHEFVIWLEPLGQGKSFQLEEIEFLSGTSEFLGGAESKLRRLKEFMIINQTVKIEIQGHVFAQGENSLAAQKLSEARAKQVYKFLVENGIDKERLTAVGLGNTKPIYENPKFEYEEQANRRVEIRVL